MNLGIILKGTREATGISQRALARDLDVSSAHVSLLEANKRTPSLGYLEAFAARFKTRVWALVLAAETRAARSPDPSKSHDDATPTT